MKVLIACEESQRVCTEFRARGHEAYSCDIIDCSGGHPEWHIKQDVIPLLSPIDHGNNVDGIWFNTVDGEFYSVDRWDLIIAHPPCTYLTVTGNRWYNEEKYGDKARQRKVFREEAVDFFMKFVNADCDKIAIENPIGIMSTRYQKPTQIVQPYFFGDAEKKSTCLWLKGLPQLKPTNMVEPVRIKMPDGKYYSPWHIETFNLPKAERPKARSKTFPGFAKAMAEQWG